MPAMGTETRGLEGLRVLSLESRRAEQIAALIRNHGGVPVSAPSMREIPIEENAAALAFADNLFADQFDLQSSGLEFGPFGHWDLFRI